MHYKYYCTQCALVAYEWVIENYIEKYFTETQFTNWETTV